MLTDDEVRERLADLEPVHCYDPNADYLAGKRDAFKEILGLR